MSELDSINELFFKHLLQYHFDESTLDYGLVDRYRVTLQALSEVSNSGVHVFDVCKRQVLFYSANFGRLLGYTPNDYKDSGQDFFADKLHPDDKAKLCMLGVSALKLFDSFSKQDKQHHKIIEEYRMMNAEGKYVRLIEQYQMLELDNKGQIWLMMGVVDVSPNQEEYAGIKCQVLNFRTGQIVPMDSPPKANTELTKRELEILKLVGEGYLSKEISNRLSISLHTVNTHRQRLLAKLGANNSMEALSFATKYGLLN